MIAQIVVTTDPAAAKLSAVGHVVSGGSLRVDAAGNGIVTALALRYVFAAERVRPGPALVVRGGCHMAWRPVSSSSSWSRFRGSAPTARPAGGICASSPVASCLRRADVNVRNCRHREPPRQRGRAGGNLATDEPGRASRPVRRRTLVQREPQSGAWPSSAGDHRSRRGRLSADGVRRRSPCDRLQRRNLQFPRAAARTRGTGRDLPQPVGYRGHSGRMASVAGRHADALQRNVGAGDLRHPNEGICFWRATASASSRYCMR